MKRHKQYVQNEVEYGILSGSVVHSDRLPINPRILLGVLYTFNLRPVSKV